MLIEGTSCNEVKFGDESDAVDGIIMSLPWLALNDVLLLKFLFLLVSEARNECGRLRLGIIIISVLNLLGSDICSTTLAFSLLSRLKDLFIHSKFVQ